MRVVKALMWLSDLVELSSSLLTISEICSRDMMEMVEEWKKGRRTEGEGEGPGKKVGGHEETARDAGKSESDGHMCR